MVRRVLGGFRGGDRWGARVGLVLDGSGSPSRRDPLAGARGPAAACRRYSPELNPAEQVFRVLRPKLANRIFATIAELEAAITEHLRPYWDQPAAGPAPHRLPLVDHRRQHYVIAIRERV